MKHTRIPMPTGVPLVGQPKVVSKQLLNKIAMETERQVCPNCGFPWFVEAKEMRTIPAMHPENPTPGQPIYVRSNGRAFCLRCHEPVAPVEAPAESQYVKREDA